MPDALHLAKLIDPDAKKYPRAGGGRIIVRCPAHEDKTPSLTVWIDDKGKAAFNCHAGCPHDTIVRALPPGVHETVRSTWKTKPTEILLPRKHRPEPPRQAAGEAEAIYPYLSERGQLLYQVHRYPGKQIRQFHPQGDTLVAGRPDTVPLVPYRLPDLIAANQAGDIIYVVEGEKDADTLAARGLTATCNVGGAGKWTDSLDGWFAGAKVVVIPDNDGPGHTHADEVLRHLQGVAETVKKLDLPGLADKGDVTDWLETHSAEELELLARQEAPREAIAGISLLDLREVMSGQFGDEEWAVPELFPKGRQISIYAVGKTGKSLVLLDINAAMAAGRSVLGYAPQPPQHVLYLDFEMTPGDLQSRLSDLGYGPDAPDFDTLCEHLHYAQLQPFAPLDSKEGGDQLIEVTKGCRAVMVTIDTLIRSVMGEENSSDTIKNFYRYTGQRLKGMGITTVRADHAGKDPTKGQRGTSAKRDDVDVVWEMKATTTHEDSAQIMFVMKASRLPWVSPQVAVNRTEDPYLRHIIPRGGTPAGGNDIYQWFIDNKVDIHKPVNELRRMYRNAGHTASHGGPFDQTLQWLRRGGR